jgi:CheY-like chemotaxis protein
MDNFFHDVVLHALEAKRHIFPVWASHDEEIRRLWTDKRFDCAFLVVENVIVPHSRSPEERIKSVLALIPWLRNRSSATIIALSGWRQPGIEEGALHGGADRFLTLPFPPMELVDLLRTRFGEPARP